MDTTEGIPEWEQESGMTESVGPIGTEPHENYVKQVKDALEHLNDLAYLHQHPLAPAGEHGADSIAGQRLRWQIVDAIEAMKPGANTHFCSPSARTYHLLTLHYVDGITIAEAASDLGVSTRQALRGLRQAERRLAVVMKARSAVPGGQQEPNASEITSVETEIARFRSRFRPTDVRQLVQRALKAIEVLSTQYGVRIDTVEMPPNPVMLSVDPVISEQVLLSIMSHLMRWVDSGHLQVLFTAEEDDVRLTLSFGYLEGNKAMPFDSVVDQLADRLGWSLTQEDQPDNWCKIVIKMGAKKPTVLVIDDNEGMIDLVRRLLDGQIWRVVGAATGDEGLHLAQELVPNVVILDLMMPEMHGWDVLQKLHMHSDTADIPVIVCSVINNPELAEAFGASIFIPKPVRRDDIPKALDQLGVWPASGAWRSS